MCHILISVKVPFRTFCLDKMTSQCHSTTMTLIYCKTNCGDKYLKILIDAIMLLACGSYDVFLTIALYGNNSSTSSTEH